MKARHAMGMGGASAHAISSLIALAAMATCAPTWAQGTGCYGVPAVPTPPTSGYIDVRTYGAVPNDDIDDAKAIQDAINAAKPGQWVRFPAGRYVMGSHVEVNTPGVTLWSDGATLHATNLQDRAVMLQADRTRIYGFTLTTDGMERTYVPKAGRIVAWNQDVQNPHISGVVIQNNRVIPPVSATGVTAADANAGAGIFVMGVQDFTVAGNEVRRPLADGIHITLGSRNGRVVRNKVYQAGDDMVAVVTYMAVDWVSKAAADPKWLASEQDRTLVRNIWIADNTLSDQYWGRGVTVAGGADITIARNQINRNTYSAGIYIAREDSYHTAKVSNVLVDTNTVSDVLTTEPTYMPSGPWGAQVRSDRDRLPTGAGGITMVALMTPEEEKSPYAKQAIGVDRVTYRRNIVSRTGYAGVSLGAYSPAGFITGLTMDSNQVTRVGLRDGGKSPAYANPAFQGTLIPLTCKSSVWGTDKSFPGCAEGASLPPAPVATGATLDCSRFPAP